MNPRITPKTCTCGVAFLGGPTAKYCLYCRAERIRQHDRERHQRKLAGRIRHIGSTDTCQICGQQYTVNAGPQKYCPACQIAESKRRRRESWIAEYYGDPGKRQKMIGHARQWAVKNRQRVAETLRKSYERRLEIIKDKRRVRCGVKLRPLGRTELCPRCGNGFIVRERNQKYCDTCR